jgi:hypothetical protein
MVIRYLLFAALGGVLVLLLATVLLARQGVVRTTDGQVIEGEIEEQGDSIIITVRGIRTIVPREQVQSIEYPPGVEEQFRQRHAELEPEDVQGRIDLARWAFDRREYALARDILEEALEIDARHMEAANLLDLVRSQIRMERTRRRAEEAPPADPDRPEAPPAPRGTDRPLLSPDQINIIRQKEMQAPQDLNIRIRFERDVRRRFVNGHPITMPEFNRLRPFEQAEMIIREGDPQMRHDVQILSDPLAMSDFRRSIQPIILAGCATSGCHGGATAGDFVLHSPANNDAAAYTNFYILQKYGVMVEARGGIFGPGMAERQLVDRSQPEQSLLVQFALQPAIADVPHPEVPGQQYRGVFRNRQDPRYRQFVTWIGSSLGVVEPDYQIDLDIPGIRRPEPEQPQEPAEDAGPEPEPEQMDPPPDDPQPEPDQQQPE